MTDIQITVTPATYTLTVEEARVVPNNLQNSAISSDLILTFRTSSAYKANCRNKVLTLNYDGNFAYNTKEKRAGLKRLECYPNIDATCSVGATSITLTLGEDMTANKAYEVVVV